MGILLKDSFEIISNILPIGMSKVYYKNIIGNVSLIWEDRPASKLTIGDLPIGSLIKFKINGIDTHFINVNYGSPFGYYNSENASIFLMKTIYSLKEWNDSLLNSYQDSTMHNYLNNDFFNLIDSPIRNKLIEIKIPYRYGSGASKNIRSGENGLLAKVFLLSVLETGIIATSVMSNDGQRLSYFIEGDSSEAKNLRMAYDTNGDTKAYWTRSPSCAVSPANYTFCINGASGSSIAVTPLYSGGIRPAIILSNDLIISSEPSDDGAYTVL